MSPCRELASLSFRSARDLIGRLVASWFCARFVPEFWLSISRRNNPISFFPPSIPVLSSITPAPASARSASIVLQSPLLYTQPYTCDHEIPEGSFSPRRCVECDARFVPVIVLARSAIHGFGVFAGHSLPAKSEIVALSGKWVRAETLPPSDESLLHPKDTKRVWRSHHPDVLAFTNHSKSPNCVFSVSAGSDIPHLLVGDVHIRAWTELTVDYGSRYS